MSTFQWFTESFTEIYDVPRLWVQSNAGPFSGAEDEANVALAVSVDRYLIALEETVAPSLPR